jgi:hypothetical protein
LRGATVQILNPHRKRVRRRYPCFLESDPLVQERDVSVEVVGEAASLLEVVEAGR